MALENVFFTRLRWTLLIVILLGVIFIPSLYARRPSNWFTNEMDIKF